MKLVGQPVGRLILLFVLYILPGFGAKAGTHRTIVENKNLLNEIALKHRWSKTIRTAISFYEQNGLRQAGLSKEAFECAYLGYQRLKRRRALHKTTILSVCDFSKSSSEERMYVIDMLNKRLLYRTFVVHGINSGGEYANSFSNRPNSYKSSLGFYVTSRAYHGENGLSLRIHGLDKGFNDRAAIRNIVIHGAPYVSRRILQKYGMMGTTFGCPAIPVEMSSMIIPVIKNGTCFFIFYPSMEYLLHSTVLNS
jgi:hypothetical protein